MAIGTTTQIRKHITKNDFYKIIFEHSAFLLHFYEETNFETPGNTITTLKKVNFRKRLANSDFDPMTSMLDRIKLPYFELPVRDNGDLILELGYNGKYVFDSENQTYLGSVIVIKDGKAIYNTLDHCYCIESIIEGVLQLGPEYLITD